ncbi:hypothetical protein [Salinicola sp. CR57]|uniref:hypothetical protein n=1 Tax=Salinicola sp. CR57 TaxID=1949086 RepID=UPI000DA1A021|nr:hypothetical protein [Salinicola sp. CR57]
MTAAPHRQESGRLIDERLKAQARATEKSDETMHGFRRNPERIGTLAAFDVPFVSPLPWGGPQPLRY